MASVTHVGMDVHKATIAVAVLQPRRKTPLEFTVPHEPKGLRALVRKLKGNGARAVSCCYEAGPTGYALQRQLRAAGVKCAVIAPALIPKKPADRVKTDRRDARKLAELWRAGLLTEVHPPSVSEEAVRDLTRAWESLRHDVTRAQHRVSKLLLRQGSRSRRRGRYSSTGCWHSSTRRSASAPGPPISRPSRSKIPTGARSPGYAASTASTPPQRSFW